MVVLYAQTAIRLHTVVCDHFRARIYHPLRSSRSVRRRVRSRWLGQPVRFQQRRIVEHHQRDAATNDPIVRHTDGDTGRGNTDTASPRRSRCLT
jgi:hypothetical protein